MTTSLDGDDASLRALQTELDRVYDETLALGTRAADPNLPNAALREQCTRIALLVAARRRVRA